MVIGRAWFDLGEQPWGDEPRFQVPCFILTHRAHETIVKGKTTYTFVTDGLDAAIRLARAAAGEKNVHVGGATVAQQCVCAGLVDEIRIHLIPVLPGDGRRLFDHLDGTSVPLEQINVQETPGVTHFTYRVVK